MKGRAAPYPGPLRPPSLRGARPPGVMAPVPSAPRRRRALTGLEGGPAGLEGGPAREWTTGAGTGARVGERGPRRERVRAPSGARPVVGRGAGDGGALARAGARHANQQPRLRRPEVTGTPPRARPRGPNIFGPAPPPRGPRAMYCAPEPASGREPVRVVRPPARPLPHRESPESGHGALTSQAGGPCRGPASATSVASLLSRSFDGRCTPALGPRHPAPPRPGWRCTLRPPLPLPSLSAPVSPRSPPQPPELSPSPPPTFTPAYPRSPPLPPRLPSPPRLSAPLALRPRPPAATAPAPVISLPLRP